MSQGLYSKVRNKLYTVCLLILYFIVTSVTLATIVWTGSYLFYHPVSYFISFKIGVILGSIDFYLDIVAIKSLQYGRE